MTYRLHVPNMFDEMIVMARHSYVKFCMNGFVLRLIIILESLIEFWVVVWRLA